MDLSDILVIKLVPLPIDHVLTVGYVMPTCNRKYSTAEIQSADETRLSQKSCCPALERASALLILLLFSLPSATQSQEGLTACCAMMADD